MPPNNPMTEGEALAVLRELRDTGDVSDWQAMESALTMAIDRLTAHTAASGGEVDVETAMHWIDRYASGVDAECQLDRVAEALAGSSDDARDAVRYRWLRRALLCAEEDPIDSILLEKEPETESEFDAAVDAALIPKGADHEQR